MATWLLQHLRPEPELTVSDWADSYRVLTSRATAEVGPYRTSRTPYLREIMDNLSVSSPIQTVVFKKASQIGASEAGVNWIGYIIDQAPGPAMLVQPTTEAAKRFSKQRIDPLLDSTERLARKITPGGGRSRDSANTMLLKDFGGGVLVITGANSAVGLRMMPVRFLMLDEVDGYPPDVEGEGDPVALADARTRTFGYRSKRFITSSPAIRNMSRISKEFDRTDQRRYFVPCPLCGTVQTLDWERLRWQPGRPETVAYQCISCEDTFLEHHKTAMLAAGEWQATAPSNDATVRGYHLSALYSPLGWMSWAQIAKQWEDAVTDVEARKTFTNTVLGEDWEEEADTVPDWQRLYDRRETWPHLAVPERGLFLTAGADLQADRIEVDIWAWGRGLESWHVEHLVFWGDPTRPEVWQEMSALLDRTWEHPTGNRLGLQRLAVDTGYEAQSVYLWARKHSKSQVLAVKGMAAYDRIVPVSGPNKVETLQSGVKLRGGMGLWIVSVSFFKRELYKLLTQDRITDEARGRGERDPPGFVHLGRDSTEEWCKQLVAEHMVIVRSKKGFAARTEWRQLRPRNEALDMRVYARAAAWLMGADRWSEQTWRDMEDQLGLEPPPEPPPAAQRAEPPTAGYLRRGPRFRRPMVRNLGNLG